MTSLPSWLKICRCQVISPRRPRPRSCLSSTLLTTWIVSPGKTGSRKCHSRDAQEGQRPHGRGVQSQPRADRRRPAARGRWAGGTACFGELVVDVDGVEVPGQAGEVDDVGLGDGAAQRPPLLADLDVIEIQVAGGERHGPSFDVGGDLPRPVYGPATQDRPTGPTSNTLSQPYCDPSTPEAGASPWPLAELSTSMAAAISWRSLSRQYFVNPNAKLTRLI